jgi:hypothetical protein
LLAFALLVTRTAFLARRAIATEILALAPAFAFFAFAAIALIWFADAFALGGFHALATLAAARAEPVAPAATPARIAVAITIKIALIAPLLLEVGLRLLFACTGDALHIAFLGDLGLWRALFLAIEVALAGIAISLRRRHRRLHLPQQTEIMISVLEIILAQHSIAGGGRIARVLQVALVHDRRRAPNLGIVRAVAFHRPVRVVVVVVLMPAATTWSPAAAALTLHCLTVICFRFLRFPLGDQKRYAAA